MFALLIPALLILLQFASGLYECNECFCFTPLTALASSSENCHSYDVKNQKFYFGNGKCLALQPGDKCYPKVYPSQEECEKACDKFFNLIKEWAKMPIVD